MKKILLFLFLFVFLCSFAYCMSTIPDSSGSSATGTPSTSYKCPSCNSNMIWTGETNVEWGQMFYLHECPAGHKYWFKSLSPKSEKRDTSTNSNYLQSPKCPVCGITVIWTGETYIEWGKMFKVYECPAGHKSSGPF